MSYATELDALGPILRWEFDPSVGEIIDQTANGLNGIFEPGFSPVSIPVNGGVLVAGPGHTCKSPDLQPLLTGGDFSVAIIAKVETDDYGYTLFSLSPDTGPSFFQFSPGGLHNSNSRMFQIEGSQITSTEYEGVGRKFEYDLVFVCVDAAAGTIDVYRNGTLRQQITATIPAIPADTRLFLNSDPHDTSYSYDYRHPAGEVVVFDRKITATEVATVSAAITREAPGTFGVEGPKAIANVQPVPPSTYVQTIGEAFPGGHQAQDGRDSNRRKLGRLYGTVTDEDGKPLERRVRVFERDTGRPLGMAWSGSDGAYEFTGLDADKFYFVVGLDYTGNYNGVIADWAKPEVTP